MSLKINFVVKCHLACSQLECWSCVSWWIWRDIKYPKYGIWSAEICEAGWNLIDVCRFTEVGEKERLKSPLFSRQRPGAPTQHLPKLGNGSSLLPCSASQETNYYRRDGSVEKTFLTAAFLRVRDWKGLRMKRIWREWSLETSMNLPLLGHCYRPWSREE